MYSTGRACCARAVFGERLDIFEYYGDIILWHYCNVAIPHVIAADLRAYRSVGVRELQTLVFGTSSLWCHGLNLAVVAWLSSGMETDVESAIRRYARERFGPRNEQHMLDYYCALEEAQSLYLAFCHYTGFCDLRWFDEPSSWYGEHRRRLAVSQEEHRQLAESLAQIAAGCTEEPYRANLQAEQTGLEIARVELEELDRRLMVGERLSRGEPGRLTDADTDQHRASRQRQWDLAQRVPVELRGQAFGALAP